MALPKLNVPMYDLELPSTKEKITYRPFLVKEEKILLLALEEENEKAMAVALKQIVNNCTSGLDNIDVIVCINFGKSPCIDAIEAPINSLPKSTPSNVD